MATEPTAQASKQPMTAPELIAYVKHELDADEERQAKVAAASAGELPRESQTGSTLDLSHKNINALPVEVVILIKDKVERLALSHNPRITLPIEIGQCDRLRYLNLRWNKLKHFPEAVLSLSKLEILDISKNAIDGIPEDIKKMTNLKFLAVARNQIKRLPFALGEMNLVKLKFDENPIEFPPPEALKPSPDRGNPLVESEKDKDMCQQVKRYMKTAAMREKLRANSEDDMSAETPRPPKRGAHGGRFPVRPSISGAEHVQGLNLKSESPPDAAPPIPQRSHARGQSSTSQTARRPGVTPLLTTGLEASRSRSESVASTANIKNRRQGYVPRKNTTTGEISSQLSARSSQAPALTPPHSRAPSVTSSFNGFLNVGGSGENSSGAVSPVDGQVSRALLSRKLASLPESRNSRPPIMNSIKVVKRVLLMLFYLYRPIADIAQQLSNGTPKRSTLERQLFGANAHVEEVDRLINGANNIIEDNLELEPALLMSITRTATTALTLYVQVIKELHRSRQQMAKRVDAFHLRSVINTAYSTLIEARNVCHMLGFQTKTVPVRTSMRASNAWSSRTVTPTQPRSSSSRRRGATILPNSGGVNGLRGAAAPPVPLHTSGSRSNTISSASGATPRLNSDSFGALSSYSNASSRSSTMRSGMSETDGEDSADRLYRKLKACCDLASQILPPVRAELASRKVNADKTGQIRSAQQYAQAVNKCDFVIATNNRLLSRLKAMRVGDPARYLQEFRQLTESFSKDWANFAGEIMSLAHNRIDIGNVKHNLKPVQYAVKDANRAVAQSLQASSYTHSAISSKPLPTAGLHGGFPPSLNTSLSHQMNIPPVPATPLGAALGPAVQATVPPTPTAAYNSPEFFPTQNVPGTGRPGPQRADTMLPPPGYPRR